MIMVASFKEPAPERRLKSGMTPKQAADELVYELRKKNIPTYTYSQNEVRENVETIDRNGRERERQFRSSQQTYCVLAGNYESNDDSTKGGKLAKDTLTWIENRFKPDFLTELDPNFVRAGADKKSSVRQLKSGGMLRLTPGKTKQGEGPLAGAFLTLNPLLTPEEIQATKQDPLLIKLNTGDEMSLYNNPGKYTLVVCSFYGKSSKAQVGMMGLANFREAQKSFLPGESLDEAILGSWELATLIRRGYFVTALDGKTVAPKPQAFDAWIWHDRMKSVVTVGSFDRLDDPRIGQLQRAFGAKMEEHALTKKPFLAAAQLTIPAQLKPNQLPEKFWVFDPKPQLVEVPRLRQ
jgi:hypothetical protein